jgi:hypothetical protein
MARRRDRLAQVIVLLESVVDGMEVARDRDATGRCDHRAIFLFPGSVATITSNDRGHTMLRLTIAPLSAAGYLLLLVTVNVWTAPAALAQSRPALTRDVDNPSANPFSKELCLGPSSCNASGIPVALPSSFTVPAATAAGVPVKSLVITFVSGNCVGTGRATEVFLIGRPEGAPSAADTGDNFTDNHFPLAVAQLLPPAGVNAVAAFASPTQIIYRPGTLVRITYDVVAAGALFCKAQLNGYFVTQ